MSTLAWLTREIPALAEVDDRTQFPGAQQGRLVRVDLDGRLFVDFPGNPTGPIAAKLAVSDMEIGDIVEGGEILLVFEGNDRTRPIVIGRLRDRLPNSGIEIHVRGRRFTVETSDEIELRCGEAKLRIARDGKVTVLGNDVVSRARRQNKIKGGTVNIN